VPVSWGPVWLVANSQSDSVQRTFFARMNENLVSTSAIVPSSGIDGGVADCQVPLYISEPTLDHNQTYKRLLMQKLLRMRKKRFISSFEYISNFPKWASR
jgi:hypothetical protein